MWGLILSLVLTSDKELSSSIDVFQGYHIVYIRLHVQLVIYQAQTEVKYKRKLPREKNSAAFTDCWHFRNFASLHGHSGLWCRHMFHITPSNTSSLWNVTWARQSDAYWNLCCLDQVALLGSQVTGSCKVGSTSPLPDLFPFFARSVEQWSTRATYFSSLFECLPCYACLALQPKKRAVVEYWSLLFKPIQSFNPYIQCLNPFKIPSMHTVIYLTYNLHVHPIIWYIAQFTIIHSNNGSEGDCWLLSHACQVDTVNHYSYPI